MKTALYERNRRTLEETYIGSFNSEACIGKSTHADLRLNEPKSSGIHAYITYDKESGQYRIVDLGTRYGTFVKGKPIQEAQLTLGQGFRVGTSEFVLKPSQENDAWMPCTEDRTQFFQTQESAKKIERAVSLREPLLQVSLYWGSQILEVKTFTEGSEITIGSQKSATFAVIYQSDQRTLKPHTLGRFQNGAVSLKLPPEATGLIWRNKEPISIDSLRHRDKSKSDWASIDLHLKVTDRASIQIGEQSLVFQFVHPAQSIPKVPKEKLDRNLLKILGALLALYGILFFAMLIGGEPKPKETLVNIPQHMKRVVIDAGIDEALKRQQAAIGDLINSLEGGRARGEEGRASAQKTPEKSSSPKADQKKNTPNKQKMHVIQQENTTVDLDAAFGGAKKSKATKYTVAAITGPDTAGNTAAALANGNFARGTKGLGAGGGGTSVGIGQLTGNATGGGMGAGDFGLAPSKGKEIRVGDLEEIVILGGLDPEIIAQYVRRYIAQIRNCYEQQLAFNPQLKGKVTVQWSIGPDGGVQSAKVVESSLASAKAEECMEKKIMLWRFPKPKNGTKVGVKFPFLFESNSGR